MWGKLQVVDTSLQEELYKPSTASNVISYKCASMKKWCANAVPKSHKTVVEMGLGGFQASDAFVHAASHNQVEVIRRWIEKQHNINLEDSEGQRALCVAAQNQCLEVLELLVEQGADINLSQKGGTTPLHIACTWGRKQAAQCLLVHNADPKVSDDDGRTPLHYACKNGHDEIVQLLLHAQVDPFVADEFGALPMDVAKDWQRIEILQYQETVYRELMEYKVTLALGRVHDRVTRSMDIPMAIEEIIHSFLC